MILVTGGTGAIGSRLVRGLMERGNRVRVLTLPDDPWVQRLDGLECETAFADVSRSDSLQGALDGVKTVFHLAAVLLSYDPEVFQRVNVEGTRNVLQCATAAGAEHFIFVSSASVVYPKSTAYSRSKRDAERIVKQGAIPYTIVRPTLAYGENGGEEFKMFLEYLKRYPVVPFIGRGRALKAPVHVDDLMRGFLAIPNNPQTHGKVYNFSGGEDISIRELARLMLKHQGVNKPFLTIPVPVCRLLAFLLAPVMKRPPLTWNVIAGITQDANLDHSAAAADLAYHPIGVRQGLQECFPVTTTP